MLEEKHDIVSERQDFAHPQNVAKEQTPSLLTQGDGDLELGPRATYINTGAAAGISQEHRDYLLARHGTLELDPLPSADPADPYNWPQWKKVRIDHTLHLGEVVANTHRRSQISCV